MKRKTGFKMIVGLVATILMGLCAVWFAKYAGMQMRMQECALLMEQVRRAAIDCYASEGRYPHELNYLIENYGLIYDDSRYSVMYEAFASNIIPDIAVSIREEVD